MSHDFDSVSPSLDELIAKRLSRRDLMRGSLAALALTAGLHEAKAETAAPGTSPFAFPELPAGVDETHHVAEGYESKVLLRWGDPLFLDAPAFDPAAQSAEKQRRQFGYNNDFVGFIPLDESGNRALLVVNHEYTIGELMFAGLNATDRKTALMALSAEQIAIEMAAHGGSVVELSRDGAEWKPVIGSALTRRITAETPIMITGPAAGHPRLRTSADPSGRQVLGMINNCSGGITPWGTWLSGEENIHYYFTGALPDGHDETRNARGMGLGAPFFGWGRFHDRFALDKEPNEPNRFGWVVEIDPHDPQSVPKKRTALGRFKHEGAAGIVNGDGRYVIYLGDDERFQRVYRFVSTGKVVPGDRAANADLLDDGVLSVARFDEDGTGRWLPLIHGSNGLNANVGFETQADVLIETRRAARLLGGTPMDRPEDIEANPKTGFVYVILTNNSKRTSEQEDPANPREKNLFGHIIELRPVGGDQAAETFAWDVLVACGDPAKPELRSTFSSHTSPDGWFGMPDNCAFDGRGRLWIATDGNSRDETGRTDGLWALETDGPRRATGRHFFQVPIGAELCGPCFTPDDETLFVAVQHPGASDDDAVMSRYDSPSTRWPDFDPNTPPRPAVVAITRKGGGKIG